MPPASFCGGDPEQVTRMWTAQSFRNATMALPWQGGTADQKESQACLKAAALEFGAKTAKVPRAQPQQYWRHHKQTGHAWEGKCWQTFNWRGAVHPSPWANDTFGGGLRHQETDVQANFKSLNGDTDGRCV